MKESGKIIISVCPSLFVEKPQQEAASGLLFSTVAFPSSLSLASTRQEPLVQLTYYECLAFHQN